MSVHTHWLASAIVAAGFTTAAFATEPNTVVEREDARAQTLLREEIAAGMRDLLRSAAPEIALPELEIDVAPMGPG